MRSLAIISHTQHYYKQNGVVVGWEPTLREINHLSQIFDTIFHIAPLYKGIPHKANISYTSNKIIFVPVIPSGGKRIIDKLWILFIMPYNLYKIIKIIRKVEWIHFRAPTNLGFIALPLLSLYKNKKKWVKYAGDWTQKSIPKTYKFQRWWLSRNIQNSMVTINGRWENQKPHLLSFENPCLTIEEINQNKKVGIRKKFNGRLTFCFVGRLEKSKGLTSLLDAIYNLSDIDWIDKLHCVGEITERNNIDGLDLSDKIPIIVHGLLDRQKINQIYKDSHFIILPSRSEGFPKVLIEASSFGCIPIVPQIISIISLINNEKKNGIVLKDVDSRGIKETIENMHNIKDEFSIYSANAMAGVREFSYEKYNTRILNEILLD